MSQATRLSWLVVCLAALAACDPAEPTVDAGTKKDGGFVLVEDPEVDAGNVEPDGGTPQPDAGTPEPDGGPSGSCGDGTLTSNEACDDGNATAGDGCSPTCTVELGFTCDADGCTTTCGDDTLAGAEECDDGNTGSGDGCSADCTVESGPTCDGGICVECGDGVVNGPEACDDSNTTAGDGCSDTCTVETGYTCTVADGCLATCGDGRVMGAESCDDRNTRAGDGCSTTCDLEPGWLCTGLACVTVCGDGLVVTGEACDDGNLSAGDGCSSTCTEEMGFSCLGEPSSCDTTCGDGIKTGAEGCDDGNILADDGCAELCTVEYGFTCTGSPSACRTVCGDGLLGGNEACDDGNTTGGDGCTASCTLSPGYGCSGEPSVCTTVCGDGVLVAGVEQCEPGVGSPTYGCADDCTLLGGLRLELQGAPAGSTATLTSASGELQYVQAGSQPAVLTGLAPGTYTVTAEPERVSQGHVDVVVDPPTGFAVQVASNQQTQATFTWSVRGGTGNLWVGTGTGAALRAFSDAALSTSGSAATSALSAMGTRFPAVAALPDGMLLFGGEANGAGALAAFSAAALYTGSPSVPQPAPAPTFALSLGLGPLRALAVDQDGAVWAAVGSSVYRFSRPLVAGSVPTEVLLQDAQPSLLSGTISSLAFTLDANGNDILWVARGAPASVRGYAVVSGSATFSSELAADPNDPSVGDPLSDDAVLCAGQDHSTLWVADVMTGQMRLQSYDVASPDAATPATPSRALLTTSGSAPTGMVVGKDDFNVNPAAAPVWILSGTGSLLGFAAADLATTAASVAPVSSWSATNGAGLAFSPPPP